MKFLPEQQLVLNYSLLKYVLPLQTNQIAEHGIKRLRMLLPRSGVFLRMLSGKLQIISCPVTHSDDNSGKPASGPTLLPIKSGSTAAIIMTSIFL